MNNKLKKSIAIFSVGVMFMYSAENRVSFVKAGESNTINTEINRELINDGEEYNDFYEMKDNYEFVSDKVEDEIRESSEDIHNDVVEEYLNENGIFDDEIADIYGDDDIEQLELFGEEDLEDISIQVEYYAVADIAEEECKNESDMVKLSDDQVDKYIGEKYYNEDTTLDEEINEELYGKIETSEENKSICDKVLMAIGVEPITAYAETKTYQGNCMLKKVVTCYKQNDVIYANFIAVAIWDTMPEVRDLDAIVLYFGKSGQYESGALNNNNCIEVTHFFNEKIWYGPNETFIDNGRVIAKMSKTTNEVIKNNQYNCCDGNVRMAIRLHPSENMIDQYGNVYKSEIEKEGVRCKTHVRLMELDKKSLSMKLEYLHKTVTVDVVGTVISLSDGNPIKALFVFLNDNRASIQYKVSGVQKYFVFEFK